MKATASTKILMTIYCNVMQSSPSAYPFEKNGIMINYNNYKASIILVLIIIMTIIITKISYYNLAHALISHKSKSGSWN